MVSLYEVLTSVSRGFLTLPDVLASSYNGKNSLWFNHTCPKANFEREERIMRTLYLGATKNVYLSFNEDGKNNMAGAWTCELDATTSITISYLVMRKFQSFFKNRFLTQSNPVLPLSSFSTFSFPWGLIVAAYFLFVVFSSVLSSLQ